MDRDRVRRRRRHSPSVQIVIGLSVAALGLLFTLDNLRVIRADDYLRFWPAVFVAIGAAQIASARGGIRWWSGAMWIAIGTAMILNRTGWWDVDLFAFWPLLLVVVGGRIFWQAFHTHDAAGDPAARPTASALAVLSGFDRKITSPAFERAELTGFMGGGKLDLRDAVPANGHAVVDVFAIMGGFEILVPRTWAIDIEVVAFMGNCDDKTTPPPPDSAPPRLTVRGFVMMGGVDIKNNR